MSKENNIIIISANESFSEKLAEKIVLLRQTDKVVTTGYINALRAVMESNASVAVLHEDGREKTLKLIKDLNKYTTIILLTDDKDFVSTAYDAGIMDFCATDVEDFEIVIRIVNALKKSLNKVNSQMMRRLLVQSEILDKDNGFYLYDYANRVISNEIYSRALEEGIFAVVAPSESSKSVYSADKLAKAIKQSVRADDIVAFGKGTKFYLLLPYTDFSGAAKVLEKIRNSAPENFDVRAGFCNIAGKEFDRLEKEGLKAVLDAMYSENTYAIGDFHEETLSDWIDEETTVAKNYKLFKHIFNKKLEKVITPVFYRLQKMCETKIPDAEIFQFADAEQSVFHIKNKHQDSKLKIVYPGFAKILIYIVHQGLDSPENREIALPLSKITTKELVAIVEGFIEEFKSVAVK